MRIPRSLFILVLFLLSLAGSLAAQTLNVSSTSLNFSSPLGGASQTQTLNITGSGGASIPFAIFVQRDRIRSPEDDRERVLAGHGHAIERNTASSLGLRSTYHSIRESKTNV